MCVHTQRVRMKCTRGTDYKSKISFFRSQKFHPSGPCVRLKKSHLKPRSTCLANRCRLRTFREGVARSPGVFHVLRQPIELFHKSHHHLVFRRFQIYIIYELYLLYIIYILYLNYRRSATCSSNVAIQNDHKTPMTTFTILFSV